MAAPQPQPDFIAIGQAYQTISDAHQTLVNEMPRLANLEGAQIQAQILNRLNALTATVNALTVTVNALRDTAATECVPCPSFRFLMIEFTFQLVRA